MITLKPIGYVKNIVASPKDDNWGGVVSSIMLKDEIPSEALAGLEEFSHAEVIYYFDKVKEEKICYEKRHPRNNPDWPEVGIFSQRGKNRPNRIGATICRVIGVKGRELTLQGLDAIDGTPVLDIKPVFKEYLPEDVKQPSWVKELMKNYWEEK